MGMSKLLTEDSLKYYLTDEAVMARPVGWELSLHTGDPGVDGTANEVTDSAYARQSIVFSVTDAVAENSAEIIFPAAAASYTVSHICVWDDTGSLLVSQMLRAPKTIAASGTAYVAQGEIRIGAA